MRQASLSQAQRVTALLFPIHVSVPIFSEYLFFIKKRMIQKWSMIKERMRDIVTKGGWWLTCHLLLWCSCAVVFFFIKTMPVFVWFPFSPSASVQRLGFSTCHFTSGLPVVPGSLYLHLQTKTHTHTFACTPTLSSSEEENKKKTLKHSLLLMTSKDSWKDTTAQNRKKIKEMQRICV